MAQINWILDRQQHEQHTRVLGKISRQFQEKQRRHVLNWFESVVEFAERWFLAFVIFGVSLLIYRGFQFSVGDFQWNSRVGVPEEKFWQLWNTSRAKSFIDFETLQVSWCFSSHLLSPQTRRAQERAKSFRAGLDALEVSWCFYSHVLTFAQMHMHKQAQEQEKWFQEKLDDFQVSWCLYSQ